MIRWGIFICAAGAVAYTPPNAPLKLKPTHLPGCRSFYSRRCAGGTRLCMRLTNAEEAPLRPETKLSGVVDDRVAALDRSADAFVEGIMVSDDDVVTIGDTSDGPVIIGEELVGLETAQESDNIAIAALLPLPCCGARTFPPCATS